MSASHRRPRGPLAKAAPAMAVTTAMLGIGGVLTLGGSPGASLAASRGSTGIDHVVQPLAPFPAEPIVQPLVSKAAAAPVVRRSPRHHRPPASAPLRKLPADLKVSATDIPHVVLAAYVNAAHLADQRYAGCDLRWQIIAGIGYIESDNARSGGSYAPGWNGVAKPPILGPVLDGSHGFGAIHDTDAGKLDGNTTWDRAVGPMQFIPSTWARYAADGNADGVRDPEQIDDATLAAGDYLCADGGDLAQPDPLVAAVLSYNHSKAYARDVLTVAARYLGVSPKSLGVVPGKLGVPDEKRHRKHRHKHHATDRHRHHRVVTGSQSQQPGGSPAPSTPASPTPSAAPTPSASPSSPSPSPTTSSAGPSPSASPSDTGAANSNSAPPGSTS